MSEEQKSEQTVVEDKTDDSAKEQGSEDKSGAQGVSDDFEQALNEYDEKASKESSSQQDGRKTDKSDEDKLIERTASRIRAEIEAGEKEKEFYKQVGEGLDLPDSIVKSYARDRVTGDKAFLNIYLNGSDRARKGLVEKIQRELSEAIKRQPDQGATEDRDAVAHAVKGGGKSAPEGKAPDYSKMSDAEYRETVQKEHGFTPI